MGCEKVVREGGNGPGGSVGCDGGIRIVGGGRRDGGRFRGSSSNVNHGIN